MLIGKGSFGKVFLAELPMKIFSHLQKYVSQLSLGKKLAKIC
jgi:hypothetical protein